MTICAASNCGSRVPENRLGLRAIHADHLLTKVGEAGQGGRCLRRARRQPREKPPEQGRQIIRADGACGSNGQTLAAQLPAQLAAQIIRRDGRKTLRRAA